MSVITVENLSKVYPVAVKNTGLKGAIKHFFKRSYRYVHAVNDVTFYVEPGEIVGFLGANGAGKTTTLKMLTGLIHPSQGRVRVAGYQPFRRQHAFLRQMSLVMGQKQQLLWDLPAIDSLKINAAVYQISDKEFRQRVGEFSEMLALEDKLSKPVRKLSLGERMKAELLAALLHYPKVLFLDEPTLGLDVNAQAAVREFLREYNQRHQATMILTSHYMADITALCERVILMHEGGLFYDGGLQELVEQFAPYREVMVEFAQALPEEKLAQYGELEEVEGREARFIIRRQDLTQTTTKLLNQLDVVDLKVSDPPIEEIIGRLLHQGRLEKVESS